MVISKLTSIPFSFTAHAHDIFLDKTMLLEKCQAAKSIIAISNYNKNYIADCCKNGIASKIRVIHCGLDLSNRDESLPTDDKTKNNIVSIGRLVRMKGFEYLIRALSKIKDKINFKCHIIGGGPLKNDLQKLIEGLDLNGRVFLDGILDNHKVKEILRRATLVTLASIWDDKEGQDGIPVVLMEAMACGIPVIASKISGIPELIEDNKTGLLRSEEHTSELQSHSFNSYAVFCLKKKN